MTIDVLNELEQVGALFLDKHFVYVSGKHGSGYVNNDPLFPDIGLMSKLCEMLVEPFLGQVDTIVAPATGGIVLSVLATRALLDKGYNVTGVWADKAEGREFVFERAGFADQVRGKRVLIVEDLLNTGFSVEKVGRLVEQHGGELVGVSVIEDRGNATAETLGVKRLESLVQIELEAIEAAACPLCDTRVPIVEDIGHGDKYKAEHPEYTGGYTKLLS